MELQRKRLQLRLGALIALVMGCGTAESIDPTTGCSTGSAALGVTDGKVAILCGCDEAGGTWVTNSGNLQCTVPSGTVVVFHYINPVNRHQVVSKPTEADVFPPSGVSYRGQSSGVRAHAITVTGPGTDYEFTDTFDSTLSARVTVR
jgi:hypothetical protein